MKFFFFFKKKGPNEITRRSDVIQEKLKTKILEIKYEMMMMKKKKGGLAYAELLAGGLFKNYRTPPIKFKVKKKSRHYQQQKNKFSNP
jgi:hypothetical protein